MVFMVCGICKAQNARTLNDSCPQRQYTDEQFSPKTLIIYYDGNKGKMNLKRAIRKYKATIIYQYNIINAFAISIPEGEILDASIAYFRKIRGVLGVEKDRICHLDNH